MIGAPWGWLLALWNKLRGRSTVAADDNSAAVGEQTVSAVDHSSAVGMAHVQASGAAQVNVAGRDIIQAPADPGADLDWWLRDGAPTFRLHPGHDNSRGFALLMEFEIVQGEAPANLDAWWNSEGLLAEIHPTIMPKNRSNAWQLKPGRPHAGGSLGDSVAFEISFHWRNAERHCRWRFPIVGSGARRLDRTGFADTLERW